MRHGAERGHDRLIHHQQQLVEHVHAPVQNHSAALEPAVAPVARHAARAVHARFDVEHASEPVFVVNALHHEEILVPAAVLMHGEDAAVLARRVDHRLQLVRRQRDGLLRDHVLARPHRLNGDGLMKIVGRGDGDQLNLPVRQQFFERVIGAQPLFLRLPAALR